MFVYRDDNSGWGSDDHMMAMEEGSQDASISALREKMALIKDVPSNACIVGPR